MESQKAWPAVGYEELPWERDADELALVPKTVVARFWALIKRPSFLPLHRARWIFRLRLAKELTN